MMCTLFGEIQHRKWIDFRKQQNDGVYKKYGHSIVMSVLGFFRFYA